MARNLTLPEVPWLRPVPGAGKAMHRTLRADLPTAVLERQQAQAAEILDAIDHHIDSSLFEDPLVDFEGTEMSAAHLRFVVAKHKSDLDVILASRATEEQVAKVKGRLEDRVSDLDVREELSELLTEVQRRQSELDDVLKAASEVQDHEIRKVEVQERRWKMWWGLLQREPVAVLVGALLLVGFSGVIVVAMWTHTSVPEVVVNMVLLILGFFFGQTASGKGKSGE